ncbi:RNA polymerase sigma factor [Lachnoclostridium sp. An138]|uniref:RNA polymerase sigma factor n=1 Tax=Lachnoclostridium sp. An138 TaxID=1965560 RepID=UPI000B3AB5AD|nr:sigma-70 family RNA polymerase sigma factor [Lachnoclostridium sp. An138]OUQ15267.1 hypothetical protein B5E82_16090 [Lachnoclostridium sp. An138]
MGEFVSLIQAIKNDKEKFEELLIKMEPLINKYVRLLYKEDKEDVYGELVLALWESVLKISYCENDGQIINFICRALKNRYYELYRNSKKRCEHEINSTDDIYFVKESSKDLTDALIISEDLYKIINTYKGQKKKIIVMMLALNLSDSEIAERLKLSRQYINRIRKNLKNDLKNYMINM